jgi:DNA-binding response OmpR family regulator
MPHLKLCMKHRAVILVVEDDPSLRTTMCAVLTLRNFFPIPAGNVESALKILGAEHMDAIVLDVRLPDPTGMHRSGLNLLKFIRATSEYANTPVIVLTGSPLSRYEEELARTNSAHVFYKPQPYSVVFDYLNGLLEQPASA